MYAYNYNNTDHSRYNSGWLGWGGAGGINLKVFILPLDHSKLFATLKNIFAVECKITVQQNNLSLSYVYYFILYCCLPAKLPYSIL